MLDHNYMYKRMVEDVEPISSIGQGSSDMGKYSYVVAINQAN